MLTLSVGRIIADRALLAVFMVVYDNPCSSSEAMIFAVMSAIFAIESYMNCGY